MIIQELIKNFKCIIISILYDMKIELYELDEDSKLNQSVSDTAKLSGKLMLFSPEGDEEKIYSYTFWKDNSYKKLTPLKVNTKFHLLNDEQKKEFEYYSHLNFKQRLILNFWFEKLWVQKTSNLMWLTNLLVAIAAIMLSTYVSLKLAKEETNPTEVIISGTTNIDPVQFYEITKAIKSANENRIIIELDSTEKVKIFEILNSNRNKEEKSN